MQEEPALPFQRLDVYVVAKALAKRVHDAKISDNELREQATDAAKSTFLRLCEGLPLDGAAMRRKYFNESHASLFETLGAVDLAASRAHGGHRRYGARLQPACRASGPFPRRSMMASTAASSPQTTGELSSTPRWSKPTTVHPRSLMTGPCKSAVLTPESPGPPATRITVPLDSPSGALRNLDAQHLLRERVDVVRGREREVRSELTAATRAVVVQRRLEVRASARQVAEGALAPLRVVLEPGTRRSGSGTGLA